MDRIKFSSQKLANKVKNVYSFLKEWKFKVWKRKWERSIFANCKI